MRLVLNEETLRTAYDYLRLTMPFRRWNLPLGGYMKFVVTDNGEEQGCYWAAEGIVRMSRRYVKTTAALMETMAHEMIHVRQHQLWGVAPDEEEYWHGADFNRMARSVCARHGFPLKDF